MTIFGVRLVFVCLHVLVQVKTSGPRTAPPVLRLLPALRDGRFLALHIDSGSGTGAGPATQRSPGRREDDLKKTSSWSGQPHETAEKEGGAAAASSHASAPGREAGSRGSTPASTTNVPRFDAGFNELSRDSGACKRERAESEDESEEGSASSWKRQRVASHDSASSWSGSSLSAPRSRANRDQERPVKAALATADDGAGPAPAEEDEAAERGPTTLGTNDESYQNAAEKPNHPALAAPPDDDRATSRQGKKVDELPGRRSSGHSSHEEHGRRTTRADDSGKDNDEPPPGTDPGPGAGAKPGKNRLFHSAHEAWDQLLYLEDLDAHFGRAEMAFLREAYPVEAVRLVLGGR